ncbi:hypothetical protein [Turicibacter sanguinis]|uniref:hypothetical protein n=1 Tax=Turicibacter sanguinis TaxID=154288 RepID=UPI002941DD50|nr:hypothetical protein [Turicibacter sanguinis]
MDGIKKKVNEKHNIKKYILSFLIIIICALLGMFFFVQKEQLPSNGTGLSGYVIAEGTQPGLTKEEIQEMLNKQVDESNISFSINSEPIFNGKIGRIVFANPPFNAHDIDLTLYLNGKEIVKTGKIKPNQYIDQIELLGNALKKGEYKGTAVITAYNQETGEVIGQANVEMDIISE